MSSENGTSQVKSVTYTKKGNKQQEKGKTRRRQFTPRKRTSECEDDGTCDLCVQRITIYAMGHCDHPICHKCSAKMRVLCEESHCAVCRVEMKKVIYGKSKRPFHEANELQLIKYKSNNVFFTDDIVKKEYEKLFEHRCSLCPEHQPEVSFAKLEAHMRRNHQLFYCDLCIRHNTNFTDECKTYSREDLAKHRRVGDDDDTSHKGHPLCEFCDTRYVDKDLLLQHLRKDHYFCHFCDQEGRNQYYDGYLDLRSHYRKEHFLCEEDDCVHEQFTSVFASELDLKAHRAAAHSQNLSRQQQRVERNIDLGFQYANPPARGGRDGGQGRGRGRGRPDTRNEGNDSDLQRAIALSLSEQENVKKNTNDYSKIRMERPRLQREPKQKKTTQQEEAPPPDLMNDFPILGSEEQEEQTPTYPSLSATKSEGKPIPTIDTSAGKAPTAASKFAAAMGRSTGTISPHDFPTLGSTTKPRVPQPTAVKPMNASRISASAGRSTGKISQEDFPTMGSTNKPKVSQPIAVKQTTASKISAAVGRPTGKILQEDFPTLGSTKKSGVSHPGGIWGNSNSVAPTKSKPTPAKKTQPISVNMPQSRFVKSNVDFGNKEDFPTLGGGSKATSALGAIWGPSMSAPIPTSTRKVKKSKTPVINQQPVRKIHPVQKTTAPVFQDSNPMANDETVMIRIGSGKHSMRLTSAKHSEDISDIERPIEVQGIGMTSVKTVNADTFSLLSTVKTSSQRQPNSTEVKYAAETEDFPALGGGEKGRIRGFGASKTPGSNRQDVAKNTPLSLSDLSKDIFSNKNSDQNFNSGGKLTSEGTTGFQPSGEDFPAITKPPPLSSYAPNWYDEPERLSVADQVLKESTFQSQESDFPSLAPSSGVSDGSSGKKNKKKKKNKGQPTASDLSKHFGNVTIDNVDNGGHLENLLRSQKEADKKSLSDLLDKNEMFAPVKNGADPKIVQKEDIIVHVPESDSPIQKQHIDQDEDSLLDPRPDEGDIQGRNMWLITTIQELCETEENFSEFKSASGSFRQGAMSAERYYEKCKILLGNKHFEMVFKELVDLLPDADKQEALLEVHANW